MNQTKRLYYEATGSKGSDSGPFWWKIYHYDETGNKEILVHRSPLHFRTESAALDACVEWMETNNVDAELS